MALVKLVRTVPEVAGGNTTCEIPEEAVEAAIRDGWSLVKKDAPSKGDKKDDSKAAPAKETKDESKVEPVKDKTEDAPKTSKGKREA